MDFEFLASDLKNRAILLGLIFGPVPSSLPGDRAIVANWCERRFWKALKRVVWTSDDVCVGRL
jgi:hypothetical protein